jgi:hypothetical protein
MKEKIVKLKCHLAPVHHTQPSVKIIQKENNKKAKEIILSDKK